MQTRSGFPTILLHANLLLAGNHRKLNRVTGPPLATAYRPADDSLAVAQDASRTRRSPAPTTPSRLWTARDTVHTDGSEIGPRGTIPRRIAVLTSAAVALRWIHEQRLWEQWFSQGRVEQYRTAVAPVWVRRPGPEGGRFLVLRTKAPGLGEHPGAARRGNRRRSSLLAAGDRQSGRAGSTVVCEQEVVSREMIFDELYAFLLYRYEAVGQAHCRLGISRGELERRAVRGIDWLAPLMFEGMHEYFESPESRDPAAASAAIVNRPLETLAWMLSFDYGARTIAGRLNLDEREIAQRVAHGERHFEELVASAPSRKERLGEREQIIVY